MLDSSCIATGANNLTVNENDEDILKLDIIYLNSGLKKFPQLVQTAADIQTNGGSI